jgi:hypothetical protein
VAVELVRVVTLTVMPEQLIPAAVQVEEDLALVITVQQVEAESL